MPNRPRQHGFTIIELIVTTAILGLMLFLVNEIFQQSSVAVTTSVQTSKTIATSRSINEQLTNDAEAMVGPGLDSDGGFIVIVQQRLPAVTMLDPQTLSELPNQVPLRSDQLVLIRTAQGLRSMTPESTTTYGTSFIGEAGGRAKVWLGHAIRTPTDGTYTSAAVDDYLGGANAGLDSFGNNFIFARQAMLFNPTHAGLSQTLNDALVNGQTFTHAAEAYYNSVVNNAGYAGANTPDNTYMGLTDMTRQDYGPVGTPGTLLYQVADATQAANHTTNYANMSYRNNAQRLRVNPAPSLGETNYASWAIAQGHPIFAQSCSEVIIDFAADLNGNGRIDKQYGGGLDTTGAIHWYDAWTTPGLGTTAPGLWTQQNPAVDFPQPRITVGDATKRIFIFRANDDGSFEDAGGTLGTAGTAHSYWPYLIRIRYRLHDTRGRLTSNYLAALSDGIDNDGDGTIDNNDEDKLSGRWFERIITVKRP